MKTVGITVLVFAAGWVARASFDSWRSAVVALTAAAYDAADRARRLAGMEREHFEDLVAEGRAEWEAARARRNAGRASPSTA